MVYKSRPYRESARMKILIVLPFSANDAVLAERNLDHIFKLNGKTAIGHVLLVANADVHAEMRAKIRVTAELAFESVTETVAPAIDVKLANSKFHQMNNLFRHAAITVQNHFRWSWLWLEPDCVPVNMNWIETLASDYDAKPNKYMGMIVKGEGGKKFMARCGIYYLGASHELDKLCQGEAPFPLATADKVMQGASNTNLIQYLKIETVEDLKKISDKAVIVHGDKMGIFSENWEPISAKDTETDLGVLPRPVANSAGAMAFAPMQPWPDGPVIFETSRTVVRSKTPIDTNGMGFRKVPYTPPPAMQPWPHGMGNVMAEVPTAKEIANAQTKENSGDELPQMPVLSAPLHPLLIGNSNPTQEDPLAVLALPSGDPLPTRLSRRQKRELNPKAATV